MSGIHELIGTLLRAFLSQLSSKCERGNRQQFPEAQAKPLHVAVSSKQPTPSQLPTPTVRRPSMRSTVRREDQMTEDMVEEREEALDLSRMPKSFPIGQAGEPTPGTTDLNEPPQGAA